MLERGILLLKKLLHLNIVHIIVLKPTSASHKSPVRVDSYCVRIYSLDLPQGTFVCTFALSGGGLGGDITGTSVRIASPVFSLAVHGWLSSARWRTPGLCGPDSLQVPTGCLAGFSAGSLLAFLEDTR